MNDVLTAAVNCAILMALCVLLIAAVWVINESRAEGRFVLAGVVLLSVGTLCYGSEFNPWISVPALFAGFGVLGRAGMLAKEHQHEKQSHPHQSEPQAA